MPWFKVDDQLAFNAKVMLAGNSAMGLWVRAGSWSSAQLTGGFIPGHMANAMANAMANPCDADALVMAGLWQEVDGGYQFHDWADFQPDAEVEKQKRKETSEARSAAGKAGARARWAAKNDGKTPDLPKQKHGKPHGKPMANEWQTDAPVPTRPDQTNREAKASLSDIAEDFMDWYLEYPRKASRAVAEKAYTKARKAATAEELLDGAKRYAADPNREQEFTKLPATWLNGGCWEDGPLPARGSGRTTTAAEKRMEQGRANHDLFALMDAERETKEITA